MATVPGDVLDGRHIHSVALNLSGLHATRMQMLSLAEPQAMSTHVVEQEKPERGGNTDIEHTRNKSQGISVSVPVFALAIRSSGPAHAFATAENTAAICAGHEIAARASALR
jgi:hypothetical protein